MDNGEEGRTEKERDKENKKLNEKKIYELVGRRRGRRKGRKDEGGTKREKERKVAKEEKVIVNWSKLMKK